MAFKNDTNYFDQHFLIDEKVINTFLEAANFKKDDIVVEIGSGKGNITKLIAPKVKKIYCIEIDERLKPYLEKVQNQNSNIELIFGNVLDVLIPKCTKIITSLPFSIIDPFMEKLLKCDFEEIIMIIGNKYAKSVNSLNLNRLSLLTNCFFKLEKIMEITPEAFSPKPKSMAAMVKITSRNIAEINDLSTLIFRFMFIYRNQKVKNALVESLIKAIGIKGEKITQRMSREELKQLNIPNNILEKKFAICSNEDLKILNKEIKKIIVRK